MRRTPDGNTIVEVVIGDADREVRDAYLWGTTPGTNYGDIDHCSVDATELCVLWFDLSAIGTDHTIMSAALTVTTYDQVDEAGGTVTVHRLRY